MSTVHTALMNADVRTEKHRILGHIAPPKRSKNTPTDFPPRQIAHIGSLDGYVSAEARLMKVVCSACKV